MTDREFRLHRRRVLALANRWIRPLGLGWWRFDFEWHRSGFDGHTLMRCASSWRYMEAHIDVDLAQVAQLADDDRLEEVVVHELLHPILSEMGSGDEATMHEERVASTLQRAFIATRTMGRVEGRKGVQ